MNKNIEKVNWQELLDYWRIDFNKIKKHSMKIPIIGDRNEKAAIQYKEQQEKKYQDEMQLKLMDFQLENNCSVMALLQPINTPTASGHNAFLAFFKLKDKDFTLLQTERKALYEQMNPDEKPKA